MEKITVGITTEFITISNLLKYAGVLETGGQAHEAIEAGVVTLNGVIVTEKRKKVWKLLQWSISFMGKMLREKQIF